MIPPPSEEAHYKAIEEKKEELPNRKIKYPPPPNIDTDDFDQLILPGNYVQTTKYTVVTFAPFNLFEQFQKKANFYFLVIAILSLTPFSPKPAWVSIAPLVFVLTVSAVKEGFEDYRRYLLDREVNGRKVKAWDPEKKEWTKKEWQEVKVGDLVQILDNEAFPADIVILKSSMSQGLCNIETANLDGETNLKIKQAVAATYDLGTKEDGSDFPQAFSAVVESSPANPKMDKNSWNGNLLNLNGSKEVYPLGFPQLLLRGCTLRNTDWIIGVVLFTGYETKLLLNMKKSPLKRSKVDKIVDRALYTIFAADFTLCLYGVISYGIWLSQNASQHWYLSYAGVNTTSEAFSNFLTFIVLLDLLVPISLYVSMELVKVGQAWFMNNDIEMYDPASNTPCQSRTSNLNEELGQVEFIFSDKTGTLTQNKMEFIRCTVDGKRYGPNEMRIQGEVMEPKARPPTLPSLDPGFRFEDNRLLAHADSGNETINEFLTLLSVCHSVLPVLKPLTEGVDVEEEKLQDLNSVKLEYQAASPDEQALVIAAKNLEYCYFNRIAKNVTIRDFVIDAQIVSVNIRGEIVHFELLVLLEFTSSRKRNSVVVRDPRDGIIKMYMKGADNVVLERLTEESKAASWGKLEEDLRAYAAEGLRTLCCAQRIFTEDEFCEWYAGHKKAETEILNREFYLEESAARLEQKLTLLGCTAIEDRLQDGVPDAIKNLADAGIKIWVLTGDKVETAINIGKSCKLLTPKMLDAPNGLFVIDTDERLDEKEAESQTMASLDEFWKIVEFKQNGADDQALVISGKALGCIFPVRKLDARGNEIAPPKDIQEKELEKQLYFLKICKKCKAVICCRVSPKQKSEVVLMVKENVKGSVTLAIGDGANDVPMIKAAHVGIGISGNEGLQAVMASDYSIAQFRFLESLLLIHGQWSYRRISKLINYSFYKNIVITLCNIWFSFLNGFSGTLFFDPLSTSAYNLVFTALPVLLLALFNRDISKEKLRSNPELYLKGQRNEFFNLKLLGGYVIQGIYHSLIIFFFGVGLFSEFGPGTPGGQNTDFRMFNTSAYTAMLFVVTIKVARETTTWVPGTFAALIVSLLLWFLFILAYSASNAEPTMYWIAMRIYENGNTWFYIVLVIVACFLPEFAYWSFKDYFYPSIERRIREEEAQAPKSGAPLKSVVSEGQVFPASPGKSAALVPDKDKSVSKHSLSYKDSGYAPYMEDSSNPHFTMGQDQFLKQSLSSRKLKVDSAPAPTSASTTVTP